MLFGGEDIKTNRSHKRVLSLIAGIVFIIAGIIFLVLLYRLVAEHVGFLPTYFDNSS